tara:strand:+ start:9913 stop:10947 length:1035 start_codon:yes stop_codon:yes gene_type:complete
MDLNCRENPILEPACARFVWPAILSLSLIAPLSQAAVPVEAITFSPNGKHLLFNQHRAILIRDLEGPSVRKITIGLDKITDLTFSPGGKHLAVTGGLAGESGSLHIVDWTSGDPATHRNEFTDLATAATFHPNGKQIAVASADRTVKVFGLNDRKLSREPIVTLTDHSRPVLDVRFGNSGEYLITASADRSLKVWKTADGSLLRSLGNHTDIVHCVAIRPPQEFAGRTLPLYCASGSDDRTVRIWQPGIGRMVRIVRYHDSPVHAVVWNPTGDRVFSVAQDGVLRMIDGDSDEILARIQAHEDWAYAVAISPDGKRAATGDWRGEVKVWRLKEQAFELDRAFTR